MNVFDVKPHEVKVRRAALLRLHAPETGCARVMIFHALEKGMQMDFGNHWVREVIRIGQGHKERMRRSKTGCLPHEAQTRSGAKARHATACAAAAALSAAIG